MVNCIGSSLLCLTGTVPFLADALPITRLGAVDTPNYNHHSTLRPRLVVSHHATMTIPLYAELEAFMSETHTQATPDRQIPGIFSADTPVASNDDNDHEREDYFGTSQRHASGAVTRTRAPHCIVRPYTNGSEDDAPIEILAGDVAVVQGQHIACLSVRQTFPTHPLVYPPSLFHFHVTSLNVPICLVATAE